MTVSSTTRTAGPYTGNGTSSTYPFNFKVFADSDLLVTRTDTTTQVPTVLTLNSDYTVVRNSDQDSLPGGYVTLSTPLASTQALDVTSDVPLTQGLSIPNLGPFYAQAIEDALDKLTIILQQLGGVGTAQTLRIPETGGVAALPYAALRANTQLLFDSLGAPYLAAPVSGSAADVLLQLINEIDATKGDALMAVKQPYSGAAARTQHDKNREAVNVRDFGAIADSETSATINAAAFAAAMAAASHVVADHGTFYLPSGTSLGVAGVILEGRGATLKQPSGTQTGNWLEITACDGFVLRGFTIDGNRASAASLSSDSSLVVVHAVQDVNLIDLVIHGSSAKGLSITSGTTGGGTRRIRASNITAYDCAVQCVMTDRSNGGTDSPACEEVILDRIFVKDTSHAGVAINDGSRRVTLSNSVIDVNNATWDAVSVRGSREVTISNVIGRRGRNGCQISVLDAAAIARGEEARNITMRGNIWEYNNQNGLLIAGGINVTVDGDIGRNNGQTTTAFGFNVTQVAGVRRSSYVKLLGVSAIDDQTSATQANAISVSAADHVRVDMPHMYGNTASNRVILVSGVNDARVHGDGDDGSTRKRVSASTGSIAANTATVVTLNFTTAFDVVPNWASASVFVGSSTPFMRVEQIVAYTTAAVQVMVRNVHATLAQTGTLSAEVEWLN